MDPTRLDELLGAAGRGDKSAIDELFQRFRPRLRRTVTTRMHPLLANRCDPSDVVQEALLDATRRLPEYLRERKLPFFVWLRQIGLDRLIDVERRHLRAASRSVFREEDLFLSDESVELMARHLADREMGPHDRLAHDESRQHVRHCLEHLRAADRELLLWRFAEQLTTAEISATLGISEAAARSRLRRALEALQRLVGNGRK